MTLKRGWRGGELKEFLLSEPAVAEVEWEQVKYTPSQERMRQHAKSARRKHKKKGKAKRRTMKKKKRRRQSRKKKKKEEGV